MPPRWQHGAVDSYPTAPSVQYSNSNPYSLLSGVGKGGGGGGEPCPPMKKLGGAEYVLPPPPYQGCVPIDISRVPTQISKVNFMTFPGLSQDKIKIFHDYFL